MFARIIWYARYLATSALVRSLEAELAELSELAEFTKTADPAALFVIRYRQEKISQNLARARAQWITFQPPGVRRTWRQS